MPALRPDPRPEPRELDARTAAILDRIDANIDGEDDRYYVDPAEIPDETSYEWKRWSTLGKEDPAYHVNLTRMGWEPVPAERHPAMMPDTYTGKTIERDGMMLMERPKIITDKIQERDYRRARAQVRDNEAQLGQAPSNTAPRDNKGTPLATVKKSYSAPIPIPE